MRDLRYQRLYGITAAEYDAMLAAQNNGCKICGRPPKKLPLHVDHDHNYSRVKIHTRRVELPRVVGYPSGWKWEAYATYRGKVYKAHDYKIYMARRRVRAMLKKASVRGLLCWTCNTGLRKFNHNPIWLNMAADYIRQWKEGNDAVPETTRAADLGLGSVSSAPVLVQ